MRLKILVEVEPHKTPPLTKYGPDPNSCYLANNKIKDITCLDLILSFLRTVLKTIKSVDS